MIISKVLGTLFGYWVFGFPGAVVGLVLGYFHDKQRAQPARIGRRRTTATPEQTEAIRQAFFTATFSVMGHVSKSDGQVRKTEIELAKSVMEQMSLTADMRASAIRLFTEGKQADFNLDVAVLRFRSDCELSTDLYRIFLQIQIQAALADGKMAPQEDIILQRIADLLGFPDFIYRQIELLVRVNMGLGDDHRRRHGHQAGSQSHQRRPGAGYSSSTALNNAYTLLGIKPDANKATAKRAYRKLMSEHHPDKLMANGLPEEMIKLATDKTQDIQKAYELVKEAKGW